MTANSATRAMLARRPHKAGVGAFGHVDVSSGARDELHDAATTLAGVLATRAEVTYHPDDIAGDGEVLVAPLKGFDAWFQAQAPWSLERTVSTIRATGNPDTLTSSGITDGGWSFYAIRSRVHGSDVVIVRSKSPSWGLSSQSKILTKFLSDELQLVTEPLIAFDRSADLVVVDSKVYVLEPRKAEQLLIDADAVKARAPQTAASFGQKVKATLSAPTITAVERACSRNANIARRVERLVRDGDLARVTASKVRAALPDAGLTQSDFGASGPLQATSEHQATVLIDIAADLYYQPRFSTVPRRVAAYRQVR